MYGKGHLITYRLPFTKIQVSEVDGICGMCGTHGKYITKNPQNQKGRYYLRDLGRPRSRWRIKEWPVRRADNLTTICEQIV
jgi:hypothetical protein